MRQSTLPLCAGAIRKQDGDWSPRCRFAASCVPEPLFPRVHRIFEELALILIFKAEIHQFSEPQSSSPQVH